MKTKHRVIYLIQYPSRGKIRTGVNVVTLHPPKAWHLDLTGDEDDETGDYVLTSLGARKTRLDMTFSEHYKIRNAPSKAQDVEHTHEIWDKYVAALEKDYGRSRAEAFDWDRTCNSCPVALVRLYLSCLPDRL